MSDDQDLYAILGVARDADEEDLRLAYRRLAWRYHPDVAGPEALARMQDINAAYQVLSDPTRRHEYDGSWSPAESERDEQPARGARASTASRPEPRAEPRAERRPREGLRQTFGGALGLWRRFDALDASPVVAAAFTYGGALCGWGQVDGRIALMATSDGALTRELSFGAHTRAGSLQALRLSPRGALVCAWGFSLGLRVWEAQSGATLWNTAISGPSGATDAMLYDSQPYIRLATPDAPLALAGDDPFRWAEDGRRATTVYSRPLTAQVGIEWLTPIRCVENGALGWLREPPDPAWRVHARLLSEDGQRLVTFSTGRVGGVGRASVAHLWELDRRQSPGIKSGGAPRLAGNLTEAAGLLQFPLTATPNLDWIAIGAVGRQIKVFHFKTKRAYGVEVGRVGTDALAALSPDGRLVALAQGRRLRLYDVVSGGQAQEWEADADVSALAFAQGVRGAMLGVGLGNGLAEIWGAA